MPEIILNFSSLHINDQDLHSEPTTELLQGTVNFDLAIDGGRTYSDLSATIKQVAGSSFDDDKPFEVAAPEGYQGPLNYNQYVRAVSNYIKKVVGPDGRVIRAVGGRLKLINSTLKIQHTETYHAEALSGACGDS